MPRKETQRKTKFAFTAAAIDELKSPKPGAARAEYWDLSFPGFGIRITDKGRRSWVLMTRAYNPKKSKRTLGRFTLGTYPPMGLGGAREAAAAKLDEISKDTEKGIDTRKKRSAPPVKAKARAIEDAVAEFFRLYVVSNLRESTAAQYRVAWYVHTLPRWEGRTVDDIRRSDVISLLDEIKADGKPIAANRTLSAVRKFFRWAAPRYDLETLPTIGVEKPGKETARERVLNDAEIDALWNGTKTVGWPFGPFVRFLLISAQRRGEVSMMRWQDIDLDKALWTIPAALTKAGRTHEVPLTPMAVELLGGLPRTGEFVFTTTGDKPLSGFSKMKDRLGKLIGFDDWTLHDLRRTAGTNMAKLRIAPSTISRVLNHAEGGVTKIYVRYGYGPEKREALATWSNKLISIVAPSDDNVVPFDQQAHNLKVASSNLAPTTR